MSAASCVIERLLFLFGFNKEISEKKLYAKMRKNAIRSERKKSQFCCLLGVRSESGVYCGMRYLVFIPREVDSAKSIMYLHGSLYMNSYRRLQARFAAELAKNTHCKVFFPLYPKLPFATVLSCFALLNNYCAFLRKKGEVIPIGDGSGAALALALCLEREDIRSVVAISPWLRLQVGEEGRNVTSDAVLSISLLDRIASLWGVGVSEKSTRTSPFFGDFSGKDLLLFAGERELLRPDIAAFCRSQSEGGAKITYYEGKGQQHSYPLLPASEGREARRTIFASVQRLLYGDGQ